MKFYKICKGLLLFIAKEYLLIGELLSSVNRSFVVFSPIYLFSSSLFDSFTVAVCNCFALVSCLFIELNKTRLLFLFLGENKKCPVRNHQFTEQHV